MHFVEGPIRARHNHLGARPVNGEDPMVCAVKDARRSRISSGCFPLMCGTFQRFLSTIVDAGSLASSFVGCLSLLKGSASEMVVECGRVKEVSFVS